LAAGSDDYISGIATPLVDMKYKGNVEYGSIILGKHCIIGSGSVVLPNVKLNDGACVGALSLVKKDLESWWLYAGIPVKKIKLRDKDKIKFLEDEYYKSLKK
jgi:galactoside O-acetyltransferase